MKRLSIRLLLLAFVFSIAGTSFKPKAKVPAASPAKISASTDQCWYWFVEPEDYFDDYGDLAYQISQMEIFSGGLVDTNPNNGELLESGYNFIAMPHMLHPQLSLYVHY